MTFKEFKELDLFGDNQHIQIRVPLNDGIIATTETARWQSIKRASSETLNNMQVSRIASVDFNVLKIILESEQTS